MKRTSNVLAIYKIAEGINPEATSAPTERAKMYCMTLEMLGVKDDGLDYSSVPITSGWRELILCRQLGVAPPELAAQYAQVRRAKVIVPNEQSANRRTRGLCLRLDGGRIVVDPAELFVRGWTAEDYMYLWQQVIRHYARRIVFHPKWMYSNGCREEMEIALSLRLPVFDYRLKPLDVAQVRIIDRRAQETVAREFPFAGAYLRPMIPDPGEQPWDVIQRAFNTRRDREIAEFWSTHPYR